MHRHLLPLILLALGLSGPAAAADFRSGQTVTVTDPVSQTLFAAGQAVTLRSPVAGDLFSAGFELSAENAVGGDAMLAGYHLRIPASIGGDLLAVGMEIGITGRIGGDARATGTTVTLAPAGIIAGDFAASGGEVVLSGHVAGDAQIAAERVVVSGRIDGTLDVAAVELVLEPGARVGGDIRHAGPAPVDVPAGVTVGGTVQYREDDGEEWDSPGLSGTVGRVLALVLLGAGVAWAAPGLIRATNAEIGANWAKALCVGLIGLVGLPVAILLLCLTVIGIPLALLLLGLYLLALPLGTAVAGFGLAEWAGRRRPPRSGLLLRFAFFALLLTLVSMLPLVGGIATMLVIALGLGALLLRLSGSRRQAVLAG
ncbi:bactofilin family protein [Oleisolibacter albus]|uniref:bactofilin family protein n=1 Tax=Oleisolibacter albus TaxID=2171757 RepID=UPI000DF249B5|nr:polymer-forming cytoskeletal protein [Oleisolibacter albus]